MKKLLFVTAVLIFIYAASSYGLTKVLIPKLGAPITNNYAATAVQLASEIGPGRGLRIDNTTAAGDIHCVFRDRADVVPVERAGVVSEGITIAAGAAFHESNFYPKRNIFCKSNTGVNITTGEIFINVW